MHNAKDPQLFTSSLVGNVRADVYVQSWHRARATWGKYSGAHNALEVMKVAGKLTLSHTTPDLKQAEPVLSTKLMTMSGCGEVRTALLEEPV